MLSWGFIHLLKCLLSTTMCPGTILATEENSAVNTTTNKNRKGYYPLNDQRQVGKKIKNERISRTITVVRNEFEWNKKGDETENTWGKPPVPGWSKSGEATFEPVTKLTASHRRALQMKGTIERKGCEWKSGCPVRTRKEQERLTLTE